MTAPSATTPSQETVDSVKASVTTLDELSQAIMSTAQADDAINSDNGAQALYNIVRGVRSKFMDPDEMNTEDEMPAAVVVILTNEIAPGLADFTVELQALWETVKSEVAADRESEPKVDEFLESIEKEDSSAMRVQNGLEKVDDAAFEEVGVALDEAVSQLGDAFAIVFGDPLK